jgi:threonine/homoserine/homoserine lactone efflux protein
MCYDLPQFLQANAGIARFTTAASCQILSSTSFVSHAAVAVLPDMTTRLRRQSRRGFTGRFEAMSAVWLKFQGHCGITIAKYLLVKGS